MPACAGEFEVRRIASPVGLWTELVDGFYLALAEPIANFIPRQTIEIDYRDFEMEKSDLFRAWLYEFYLSRQVIYLFNYKRYWYLQFNRLNVKLKIARAERERKRERFYVHLQKKE